MDTPVDYSVFYYTYSTIAQTLAGAFGFLVAVVLYQRQVISSALLNQAAQLRGIFEGKATVHEMEDWITRGLYREFVKLGDRVGFSHLQNDPIRTRAENTFAEFKLNVGRWDAIASRLQFSMIATGTSIIWCLVFMPLTNRWIICSPELATIPLVIAVIGAILSILTYLSLVKDSTR